MRLVGHEKGYTEIPTIPGTFEALARKLESLQLDKLVDEAQSLMQGVERLVNSPELIGVVQETHSVMKTVDAEMKPLLLEVRQALGEATDSFAAVKRMLQEESEFRYLLAESLRELSASARSIRVLADYLERHPDSVIFGKSGPGGN